jgi:hypothetical protein
MNRYLALLVVLTSMGAALYAQDKPPALLWEAAQCLATDKHQWIDLRDVKTLDLAYETDSRKFAGNKYLFVIVYGNAQRSQGRIFDISYRDEPHHRVYSIENNADFVSGPNKNINFTEPPLGGNWTQTQLSTAIQKMLHSRKWYEAQVKFLIKPSSHIRCETKVEDVVAPKAETPQTGEPK